VPPSPLLSPLGQVYVSNVYKSERGDQCVKCSYKTNDGLLFPLQKLLIFIHKPTIVLRYEDVESVEFLRVAANALSGGPPPPPLPQGFPHSPQPPRTSTSSSS
jgi:hypothetical protein